MYKPIKLAYNDIKTFHATSLKQSDLTHLEDYQFSLLVQKTMGIKITLVTYNN